ncbi:MAG: hypothetical protein M1398_03205 [Deltaproteobacteria bacterium]|nr:hypothetical protein [Deltaproteobacteria bacterium]
MKRFWDVLLWFPVLIFILIIALCLTGLFCSKNIIRDYGPLGTFLVALVAVWAGFLPDIRSHRNKPELNVRLLEHPPDSLKESVQYIVPKPPIVEIVQAKRYMFRLWVFNEGHARAEKVQVFADKLKKKSVDGKFVDVNEFLPMSLVWSNTGTTGQAKRGEAFLEGISPRMGQHCDIGHINEPDVRKDVPDEQHPNVPQDKTLLALDVQFRHSEMGYLLEPGSYELHLKISAASSPPVSRIVRITLSGGWDGTPEKMYRDHAKVGVV